MSCVKWQAYNKTRTYNGIMEGNIKAVFRGRQHETKTVASYTFLKRLSTLDAHWRRKVRILTATLPYFKVYLRGLSAAQTIWRPKDRVFNKKWTGKGMEWRKGRILGNIPSFHWTNKTHEKPQPGTPLSPIILEVIYPLVKVRKEK